MLSVAHITTPSPQPGFFVGWGTLALLNAGLAQCKNRSGLNWFLVSLLLGPLGTLLLVLAEKRPDGPRR